MTKDDVERERAAGTPVIIPFGSVEQHGSHLPLATDTLQAYGVAARAAIITRAVVAPPVHFGLCSSTRNHPGTITVSGDTLRSMARDLIQSFTRQGFPAIILYSGHAGRIHMAALREAAENSIQTDPMLKLAVVSDLDLLRETAGDLLETPGDGHAGEIETSRMLHLHGDKVRGTSPEEYPSFPSFRILPDPERFWPGGVWGNPAAATAQKGEELVNRTAAALAGIVKGLFEV
ncbi:creatinine amidohydrolase [bacterium BMS3Abin14]|nr:creatinine amidohydrolase [bacterium BMS3Abin14]